MRAIVFLIIFFCFTEQLSAQKGQPTDFSLAVEKGKDNQGEKTCGIFTYDPRIENGYYYLDLYGRCYSNDAWVAIYKAGGFPPKNIDLSNFIGSIGFSVLKSDDDVNFDVKYESGSFELAPVFYVEFDGVKYCRLSPLGDFNIASSSNSFQVAYGPDVEMFGDYSTVNDMFSDRIIVDVPFYLGTLKLKIKAGAEKYTSGISQIVPSGSSIGVWDPLMTGTSEASTDCAVVGWLDGKDPNIPLAPEAESTVPEDPVFASGDSPRCPGNTGNYVLIGASKNATSYDWWVATDAEGNNKVTDEVNIAQVTPAADGLGVAVDWKTGAAGNTYYVCVQAKNDKDETSGIISWPVVVSPLPEVTLAMTVNGQPVVSGESVCGNLPIVLSLAKTESGVTYTWTGDGVSGNGTSKNFTLSNPTNTPVVDKIYQVTATTADGCSASDEIKITANPAPEGLYWADGVDLSNMNNGKQVTLKPLVTKNGPLTSWAWTEPKVAATENIDVIAQNGMEVTVEAGNAYGCKIALSEIIKATGGMNLDLALKFPDAVLCPGGSVPLYASVSGLTGATYTYTWYKGRDDSSVPVNPMITTTATENYYAAIETGWYTVKVTGNGDYVAMKSIEVKQTGAGNPFVLTVEPEIVAATPDKKVVLLAEASGTGSRSWLWTPASKLNAVAEATKQYPLTAAITETTDFQVFVQNTSNKCVASGQTRVRIPDPATESDLLLSVAPSTISLCLNNTVQLNAVLTGVSVEPGYTWTSTESSAIASLSNPKVGNPIFTAKPANVGSNPYIVQAEADGKVVTTTAQVTVKNENAPTITPKPEAVYCVGTKLEMPVISGISKYQWLITNKATGNVQTQAGSSIQFADAGIYDVKVVGITASSCVSDTIRYTDLDIRKLELTQTLSAATYKLGQEVSSTAVPVNGWGNYVYTWTSPLPRKENTTEDIYTVKGASADSYTFDVSVVDEKGCQAQAARVTATVEAGGLHLEVDTMNAYCNKGMAMLQAKISGGQGNCSYEWTLVGGDGSILSTDPVYLVENPQVGAQYQVVVKDQSSPQLVRTEVIDLDEKKKVQHAPLLTTAGTLNIQSGTSALLSVHANPLETTQCRWNWSPGEKLKDLTEVRKQYPQTAVLTAGTETYQVYMIDGNGCISPRATQEVKVEGDAFQIIEINALQQMCKLSTQALSATLDPQQNAADLEYTWTSVPVGLFNAANCNLLTPEITPSTAGTYTIILTVYNKVTDKKNTTSRTIDVTGDQIPILNLAFKSKVCEGDAVTVTPAPSTPTNGVYAWYVNGELQTGVTGNQFILEGIHGTDQEIKVEGTGTNGCIGNAVEMKTINARPGLIWKPELPVAVEVNEVITAIVVDTLKGTNTYAWTVSKTGTQTVNQYTVTAEKGDKQVDLKVVATNITTTCQSKPLTGVVKVNGLALECDIVQEGLACVGGSTILKVKNITGDPGPYIFKWTKKGETTLLGTDSILIVPTSAVATEYVVALEANSKKGESSLMVNPTTGVTVPTVLACGDITIPVNTQAVLTANATGTKPFSWNWGPVADLKSAGEACFQSPVTRSLDRETDYYVWVKDATQCVSAKDDLKVKINGTLALRVEIEPEAELCIHNHQLYRAIVTDNNGLVVAVDAVEWKAVGTITQQAGNRLAAEYTALKAGADTIVVVVTKQIGGTTITGTAKKVIQVKPYEVPALEFVAGKVSCAGDILTVSTQGGSTETLNGQYSWVVTKDGGVPDKATSSGGYTLTEAGNYVVKVMASTQHCKMDTLTKEISIAPIPVIAEIRVDSMCGTAKVIAVTQHANAWEWTDKGVIMGSAGSVDSIRYYGTVKMSEEFSGSLIVKNTSAGCVSVAKEFAGTVYALPTITLNPASKSVYPNTAVAIEATITPDLAYTLNWNPADLLVSGQGSKKITTRQLVATDVPYKFALEVTNPAEVSCKTSDTAYISVDDKDFRVDLAGSQDTVDVCQDIPLEIIAKVENNKYGTGKVTYKYGSDYSGFAVSTNTDRFTYTYTTAGIYKVWVEATNDNTPPDVRRDTVVLRVNPTPVLKINSPDLLKEHSLCENMGDLKINLEATGKSEWKFYYKFDNVTKSETFVSASHVMSVTAGGSFVADSIVDGKGCKAVLKNMGFDVVDDVPRVELTSTDEIIKCQGTGTDLNIKITNASDDDYPMTLYYLKSFTAKESVFADAGSELDITEKGKYTVDSLRSKRGCVFKLAEQNVVNVSEFVQTTPLLTLTDKTSKSICDGESVNIPVQISNGGLADYTITYTLNGGAQQSVTLPASGNIQVSDNGPLMIKGFKDKNGCGTFTADETVQIVKYDNPVMEITTSDRLLCGGTLDLGLNFIQGTAPYQLHYRVNGGAEQVKTYQTSDHSLEADGTAVWTLAEKGNFEILEVTDANACSVAGSAIAGGPTVTVDSFRLYVKLDATDAKCATKEAKLKFDFSGTAWDQVMGDIQVDYDFIPVGGTKQALHLTKTKAEAQAGNVELAVAQGTYTLTGVTDLKTTGNGSACEGILPVAEAEKTVTVIQAPVVEIDSLNFAVYKGEVFKLGIKEINTTDFEYAWQLLPNAYEAAKAPDYTLTATMNNADMVYVLKGTNRSTSTCFSTDTVHIYKIPDAPKITIDTNNTRNDLVLKFDSTNPNDEVTGYRIMHNYWDGYAIEKPYSPKVGSILSTYYELAENKLDTLEFFYVNAYRVINRGGENKTYYSESSDTVGYKRDDINLHPVNGKTSNNVISWCFDMPAIKTSADLFDWIGDTKLNSISSWNLDAQEWLNTTTLDPMHDLMPDIFDKYQNVFDLKPGEAYEFDAVKKGVVLQFGRLFPRFVYDMTVNATRSNNYVVTLSLHKIELKNTSVIFRQLIKENINGISLWDFTNQGFYKTVVKDPMYDIDPDSFNEFDFEYEVKPLTPIQLDIVNPLLWK